MVESATFPDAPPASRQSVRPNGFLPEGTTRGGGLDDGGREGSGRRDGGEVRTGGSDGYAAHSHRRTAWYAQFPLRHISYLVDIASLVYKAWNRSLS